MYKSNSIFGPICRMTSKCFFFPLLLGVGVGVGGVSGIIDQISKWSTDLFCISWGPFCGGHYQTKEEAPSLKCTPKKKLYLHLKVDKECHE